MAASEDEFWRRIEKPREYAWDFGAGFAEFLARALPHSAALAEPRDLAWLLASYARDGLARLASIAAAFSGFGRSFPRVQRANPFGPLNNVIGPDGERWVPVHGVVPHSRPVTAMYAIVTLLEREAKTEGAWDRRRPTSGDGSHQQHRAGTRFLLAGWAGKHSPPHRRAGAPATRQILLCRDGVLPANWKLIRELKRQLDPKDRRNPGALGLLPY